MRKALIAFALVLLAVPAFAQSADRPLRVSLFMSDFGFAVSEGSGSDVSGGVGVALEYRWKRAWSGEVSVASEEHTRYLDVVPDPGSLALTIDRYEVRAYPVDTAVRYHLVGVRTRWRPYVGAGVRYVPAPSSAIGEDFDDRLSAQAIGGVDYNATDRISMRFDVKRLLRSDSAAYDNVTKVSVGVGYRF